MSVEVNTKKLTPVDLLEESDFEEFIEPSVSLDSDNLIDQISRTTTSHDIDTSIDIDEGEMDIHLVSDRNQCTNKSEKDPFLTISQPIVIVMDIREPLTTLQRLLEEKICIKLGNCSFSLQNSQILNHHKNLVDLCVQGEGNVQINCELKKTKTGVKVNIADVLKLDEEFVQMDKDDDMDCVFAFDDRWSVAYDFRRDQKNLGIPEDPSNWSVENVRHWLMWAVRQFSLSGIKLSEWELNGADLLKMTREEFKVRVPIDPNNSFWIHFELLRSCKIVAINRKPEEETDREQESQPLSPISNLNKTKDSAHNSQDRVFKINKLIKSSPPEVSDESDDVGGAVVLENFSNLGSMGPVQLWQFLLELLTNRQHRNAIQWLEDEGEFKLINPELVAHLWGIRKNKPTMNYEKLSRALRYYYDGEMISKVNGKRFTYKFVCDLKQLIGYSASELNSRVIEAELKAKYSAKKEEERAIYVNEFITVVP